MNSYDKWNKALIEYFTAGLSNSSSVYLSVDDDVLCDIGRRIRNNSINEIEDFVDAVRSECIQDNVICLEKIKDFDDDNYPRCVAFLGAMVYAAYQMANEESEQDSISEINYFTRLRKVLNLSGDSGGRPPGLNPTGIEESLWNMWNHWVVQNGWTPSAERADKGTYKYINYPLSQALLRKGDKERIKYILLKEAKEGNISRTWDIDRLSAWFRRFELHINSKHLKNLIKDNNYQRYEALINAIYDIYFSIDWNEEIGKDYKFIDNSRRKLTAGLYREEDLILGEINYYLYPKQPRRWQVDEEMILIYNDQFFPLVKDRPGWFRPAFPVDPSKGYTCQVKSNSEISELVLSERGFWILVQDNEVGIYGAYASWGYPGIGENFILLCKEEYSIQLEILKQEKLINWYEIIEIKNSNSKSKWLEYQGCMILSPEWDYVIPQNDELFNALKPNEKVSLSLKGGLHLPSYRGYLENFAPELFILSLEDVKLEIINLLQPDIIIREVLLESNSSISFNFLEPGNYLVQAVVNGKIASKRWFSILSWNSIKSNADAFKDFDIKDKFSILNLFKENGDLDKRQVI